MASLIYIWLVCITSTAAKEFWNKGDLNIGYDFENNLDMENIVLGKEQTKIVSSVQKHGARSLLWRWKTKQPLQFDLTKQLDDFSSRRNPCGIHFWIYQERPVNTKLRVTFHSMFGHVFSFRLNMNFKYWRAIARTFRISSSRVIRGVNKVTMQMENLDPFSQKGELHVDLLRVSTRCVGWSYDEVNPPQVPMEYGLRNAIGGLEDLTGVYEVNHFWQMMYKWRKVDIHASTKIDAITPLTAQEDDLTKELVKIERKVDDWYFSNEKSFASLDEFSTNKMRSLFNCVQIINTNKRFRDKVEQIQYGNYPYAKKKIFSSTIGLRDICIDSAYRKYLQITGKHLFSSRDVFPYGHEDWSGMKFNEVIHRILFPMSLEYFITKRSAQRKHLIKIGSASRASMHNVLKEELRNEPNLLSNINTTKTIRKAYKSIDSHRLLRLTKIFKFLQVEGWGEGSALGNTDHLLNLNEGFTQSIYLLRRSLSKSEGFQQLLLTSRWYNEIGEIHQEKYQFKGTTADKAKNVIGRLLLVLASPHGSVQEARQKISDIKNLKSWIENALEINEGYAGILKPDYTGYHHKGVYMSAYTSEALHALSLASYYLHSTPFAISPKHLNNLKQALKTMYLLSNSFSIPLSVSGAKVQNSATVIKKLMSAFAYMAISLSSSTTTVEPEMASYFLSLYRKENPFIQLFLWEGRPMQTSRYLNSIGSLDVLEKVKLLSEAQGISPAKSPQGNWAFNYASLSLHRRDDWSVAVKGFSKYTWDFESYMDQNIYGRYLSHGHLQISKGKKSLLDILNGWDWNRFPGTTTVELDTYELVSLGQSRYFQNSTSVGGSTFGKPRQRQGVFMMDFTQPKYQSEFFKKHPYEFSFKKSYFFLNNLIVCLGSNIRKTGLKNRKVVTTLFQESLSSGIIVLNDRKYRRDVETDSTFKGQVTLLDRDSNGYYIPSRNNDVQLKIGVNRYSMKPNGEPVSHPKAYASAVFQHGAEPKDSSYEYVVLVDTTKERLNEFSNYADKIYRVIQQDSDAHVVKFTSPAITAYNIFNAEKFRGSLSTGPIHTVNRASVITIHSNSRYIVITAMDPDLRRFDKFIPGSKGIRSDVLYNSASQPAGLKISFNGNLRLISKRCPIPGISISDLYDDITKDGAMKKHIALNLSRGVTCTMKFKK